MHRTRLPGKPLSKRLADTSSGLQIVTLWQCKDLLRLAKSLQNCLDLYMAQTAEPIAQTHADIGLHAYLLIVTYLDKSCFVKLVKIFTLATPLKGWQCEEIPARH